MWVYIASLATTALALIELWRNRREYKTNIGKLTVLSLIVIAGIGGALGTYFSDRAAEKKHEEDEARITHLQATLDAQGAKLDTIMLLLEANVERPSPSGPSVVKLSWKASARGTSLATQVVGYFVYRSSRPHDRNKMRLNVTPITTTSYVDSGVDPGNTYYYDVRALSAAGLESAPSNEIVERVPVS